MPETKIGSASASDLKTVVKDYSVDAVDTDAAGDQEETTWQSSTWSQNLGYYKKIPELLAYDKRIGTSHLQVPGPDGRCGSSGVCFPKDLNGFKHLQKSLDIKPTITSAVWEKNLEVRPDKDWEKLLGRCIVGDE